MSGTLNSIYNNASLALYQHAREIARLQEQASTGSRVNRASDDPSAAYEILGLNSEGRSLDNYMNNISDSLSVLTASTTSIDSMKSSISKAIELISGISATSQETNILLEGVDSALEELVMWANSDYLGNYLFAGSDTATKPYVVQRTNGRITSVTYQGDSCERTVEVAPGVQMTIYYAGDDIFGSNERSAPIFPGGTGAEAGTGTSSVTGDVFLTVTGSAGNYDLSIDGGLSTVNTNGTDTNLAVTDSRTGKVLYVDTTNINSTGVDWIRIPGTYDVFNTLINIRDRIESGEDIEELRTNALESLDEVYNQLVRKGISIGSKIGLLDDLKGNLSNVKFNTEDNVSRLQDADITEVAIELSRRQVLYEMSLAMAARLASLSLLDFIR